jgi:hypothetical protein
MMPAHLALEHHRQHQHVERRVSTGRWRCGTTRRHVGEEELALLDRALPDQALAEVDLLAVRALAAGGVARQQLQLRLSLSGFST